MEYVKRTQFFFLILNEKNSWFDRPDLVFNSRLVSFFVREEDLNKTHAINLGDKKQDLKSIVLHLNSSISFCCDTLALETLKFPYLTNFSITGSFSNLLWVDLALNLEITDVSAFGKCKHLKEINLIFNSKEIDFSPVSHVPRIIHNRKLFQDRFDTFKYFYRNEDTVIHFDGTVFDCWSIGQISHFGVQYGTYIYVGDQLAIAVGARVIQNVLRLIHIVPPSLERMSDPNIVDSSSFSNPTYSILGKSELDI